MASQFNDRSVGISNASGVERLAGPAGTHLRQRHTFAQPREGGLPPAISTPLQGPINGSQGNLYGTPQQNVVRSAAAGSGPQGPHHHQPGDNGTGIERRRIVDQAHQNRVRRDRGCMRCSRKKLKCSPIDPDDPHGRCETCKKHNTPCYRVDKEATPQLLDIADENWLPLYQDLNRTSKVIPIEKVKKRIRIRVHMVQPDSMQPPYDVPILLEPYPQDDDEESPENICCSSRLCVSEMDELADGIASAVYPSHPQDLAEEGNVNVLTLTMRAYGYLLILKMLPDTRCDNNLKPGLFNVTKRVIHSLFYIAVLRFKKFLALAMRSIVQIACPKLQRYGIEHYALLSSAILLRIIYEAENLSNLQEAESPKMISILSGLFDDIAQRAIGLRRLASSLHDALPELPEPCTFQQLYEKLTPQENRVTIIRIDYDSTNLCLDSETSRPASRQDQPQTDLPLHMMALAKQKVPLPELIQHEVLSQLLSPAGVPSPEVATFRGTLKQGHSEDSYTADYVFTSSKDRVEDFASLEQASESCQSRTRRESIEEFNNDLALASKFPGPLATAHSEPDSIRAMASSKSTSSSSTIRDPNLNPSLFAPAVSRLSNSPTPGRTPTQTTPRRPPSPKPSFRSERSILSEESSLGLDPKVYDFAEASDQADLPSPNTARTTDPLSRPSLDQQASLFDRPFKRHPVESAPSSPPRSKRSKSDVGQSGRPDFSGDPSAWQASTADATTVKPRADGTANNPAEGVLNDNEDESELDDGSSLYPSQFEDEMAMYFPGLDFWNLDTTTQ